MSHYPYHRDRPKYEKRITVCFCLDEVAALDAWVASNRSGYGYMSRPHSRSSAIKEIVKATLQARQTPTSESDPARGGSDKGSSLGQTHAGVRLTQGG